MNISGTVDRLLMEAYGVLNFQTLGAAVVDKTELKGLYDFTLRWTPDDASAPADEHAASIYTAVQEQLGLRLVSRKDDMEVLVIDRVEKPTEN